MSFAAAWMPAVNAIDQLTPRTPMTLPDGLYDLLVTERLARSLAAVDPASSDVFALNGGAADFLSEVITRQLVTILDDVSGDESDKTRRQLELVNELLVTLRQRL